MEWAIEKLANIELFMALTVSLQEMSIILEEVMSGAETATSASSVQVFLVISYSPFAGRVMGMMVSVQVLLQLLVVMPPLVTDCKY